MGPSLNVVIAHVCATNGIPLHQHRQQDRLALQTWRNRAAGAQTISTIPVPQEYNDRSALCKLYHTMQHAIDDVDHARSALTALLGDLTGSQISDLHTLDEQYNLLMRRRSRDWAPFPTTVETLTSRRLTAALRTIEALLLNEHCGNDSGRVDGHPRQIEQLLTCDEYSESLTPLAKIPRRKSRRTRT